MLNYYNAADYEYEPDEPIAGRCVGFQKGCGRFVANGGTLCPRCRAEGDAWVEHEANEDKRIAEAIEAERAYWDAYWTSPEGLAEIEAERKRAEEYAAEYTAYLEWAAKQPRPPVEEFDDLPW